MVIVSVSLRKYVYDKVFPEGEEFQNKSERVEKLIVLGLENENKEREEE